MKIANVKGFVAKLMLTGLAAGAFLATSPVKAQAQQWAVGVQFGHPAYVYDYDYRNEEYRERQEAYARQQAYLQHERWEAEQREAYARQQAYFQHERWEAEQREAEARRLAYAQHEYWEHARRDRDDDDDR